MPKQNRRDFIKTVGAAAASMAAVPALAEGGGQVTYDQAVLAHPSLLAFWRFEGDIADAKGKFAGEAKGGAPAFVDGALGGKALAADAGRFIEFGPTPAMDTDAATVELFFKLPKAPALPYNMCLLGKRGTHESTRYSVHIMGDLRSVAVWNGGAVMTFPPLDGPIEVGRWYHVAIVSGQHGTVAFIDGVQCAVEPGPAFDISKAGQAFHIGASTPEGAESAVCCLDEVAIYGAELKPAEIAAHVDAAGWGEKRRKLEEARADIERKRREEAEKAARERAAKLEALMHDPALLADGAQTVYAGDHLTGIYFGLGGIGAGSVQMDGKAERPIWQIFNNFTGGPIPNTFFAVSAKAAGGQAEVRALQKSAAGPIAGMKSLTFRGEYPFAWYDFEDDALPVKASLEAFTPLIPMRAKDSAIPCAIFNLTLVNPGKSEVEAAVVGTQQNAVGYSGGPVLSRSHKGYGGNCNRVAKQAGALALHLTSDGDRAATAWGDMALLVIGAGATGAASWAGAAALRDQLAAQGKLAGPDEAGPSPAGETIDGAVCQTVKLKPGQSKTVTFVLAWYFPNAHHGNTGAGWGHEGNQYAKWWPDALAVANEVVSRMKELTENTRRFHAALYETNVPYWLRDRLTSQLGVLRSKTCFWAGDGYFGGWEGCGQADGCCHGSCTHVWHYAQAHARLFPELGRKMRELTYSYQRPDGGLPHRHPNVETATDGHLGDILGAYREHLCGTDQAWLDALWPKVKKAMEYAIGRWDKDEDGVFGGAQWNTLDDNLGGSTSWMGTLYLAALAACARIAEMHGEADLAKRYLKIHAAGAKNQNDTLYNGEYYIQIRDAKPYRDYGEGCHIDQVLGEWWANQVELPTAYPADRVRSAMKSLVKYNFRASMKGVPQSPRKFVSDEDACLQMICWPKGERPVPAMLYGDEAMTGFEYAAAATMVQFGLIREGFLVAKAVHDRYDGRIRQNLTPGDSASWGYSGNPFGDDECGKYYARAMSVWSLLLACQGFIYDGPAGVIGFRPVWKPEDHRSFFTGAEGWGVYSQKRSAKRLEAALAVRFGHLKVREVRLDVAEGHQPRKVTVKLGAQTVPATLKADGAHVSVVLAAEATVDEGLTLSVVVA